MGTPICHPGSALSHGGAVIQGSPNYTTKGIPVSRVGDAAICAIHGPVVISSGSPDYNFDGKACARIGSSCSCGATLVSSQSNWTVT